jgi:hypothetical protein
MEDRTRIADRHGILSNNRRGMLIKKQRWRELCYSFLQRKRNVHVWHFCLHRVGVNRENRRYKIPKGTILEYHVAFIISVSIETSITALVSGLAYVVDIVPSIPYDQLLTTRIQAFPLTQSHPVSQPSFSPCPHPHAPCPDPRPTMASTHLPTDSVSRSK